MALYVGKIALQSGSRVVGDDVHEGSDTVSLPVLVSVLASDQMRRRAALSLSALSLSALPAFFARLATSPCFGSVVASRRLSEDPQEGANRRSGQASLGTCESHGVHHQNNA